MLRLKDLNTRIERLEMRIEQLRIHLQSLSRASAEAAEVRSMLYGMLQQLANLKEDREELQAALEPPDHARL
jgi:chaperonin cofactor prefoldin